MEPTKRKKQSLDRGTIYQNSERSLTLHLCLRIMGWTCFAILSRIFLASSSPGFFRALISQTLLRSSKFIAPESKFQNPRNRSEGKTLGVFTSGSRCSSPPVTHREWESTLGFSFGARLAGFGWCFTTRRGRGFLSNAAYPHFLFHNCLKMRDGCKVQPTNESIFV